MDEATRGQKWGLAFALGCLPCAAAFLASVLGIGGSAALALLAGPGLAAAAAAGVAVAGAAATALALALRRRRACKRDPQASR